VQPCAKASTRGQRLRNFGGFLGNQRAGNRRAKRVALIVGVRLNRRHTIVGGELGAGVYRVVFRAQNLGALGGVGDVLARLPHIDRYRHDMLEAVLFP
jgi:hypothetical protein